MEGVTFSPEREEMRKEGNPFSGGGETSAERGADLF